MSKVITKAVKDSKVCKKTKAAKTRQVAIVKAVAVPKVNKATSKPQTAAKPATNNPYRVGGGYWASVEALRSLGLGKMHAFDKIVPAVVKAMRSEKTWEVFAAKDGNLSAEKRVLQNVMVTSRKDYGKPLIECGFEVRYDGRERVAGLFKL